MTRFADEIREMPAALAAVGKFYRAEGKPLLDLWRRKLAGKRRIVFSGMGSSVISPAAIRPALARAGLGCEMIDAGEWLHYGAAAGDDAVTVLVSQSGESYEVAKLIERGLAPDGMVAITNDPDSTLGKAGSLTLPMLAGEEASVSTKTYANTLAVLHLMASAANDGESLDAACDAIEAVARQLLAGPRATIDAAARALLPAEVVDFVGRGPCCAAAGQSALTFMEGCRCQATAFTGGAFRHGPLEVVDTLTRAVFFLPIGDTRDITLGLAAQTAELGGAVVAITDGELDPSAGLHAIVQPRSGRNAGEELFPLAVSATQCRLLYAVGVGRGVNVGQFRYGSKITRTE